MVCLSFVIRHGRQKHLKVFFVPLCGDLRGQQKTVPECPTDDRYLASSPEKFSDLFLQICMGSLQRKTAGTSGQFLVVSVPQESKDEESSKHTEVRDLPVLSNMTIMERICPAFGVCPVPFVKNSGAVTPNEYAHKYRSDIPDPPILAFLEKARVFTQKSKGFSLRSTPKIPGKERKNAQKARKIGKKQGHRKKQGLEGQGFRSKLRFGENLESSTVQVPDENIKIGDFSLHLFFLTSMIAIAPCLLAL